MERHGDPPDHAEARIAAAALHAAEMATRGLDVTSEILLEQSPALPQRYESDPQRSAQQQDRVVFFFSRQVGKIPSQALATETKNDSSRLIQKMLTPLVRLFTV